MSEKTEVLQRKKNRQFKLPKRNSDYHLITNWVPKYHEVNKSQKQPSRGVLKKKSAENM